jgi:hypothetical protein
LHCEPLAGRGILVHADHGLGDTLQLVRYVDALVAHGAGRVWLGVQTSLHPLLADSGYRDLVPPEGDGASFDVHISIMDLPCVFRSTDETLPARVPYLRAQTNRAERWRGALSAIGGLKVGIAWQGNRNYAWDHLRSIPLAEFGPLAAVEGVRLVALQQGDGRRQLKDVSFPVVDLGEAVDRDAPFVDTAAIIAGLDLVIASDSALAHLAGALAAPIWLVLPRGAEWRWKHQGETTAWYPTMRLFRQRGGGGWAEVMQQVARHLQLLARRPP